LYANVTAQLEEASKAAAARELSEESRIDIRNLDRLESATLQTPSKMNETRIDLLQNYYHRRLFFFLKLTDNDFPAEGMAPTSDRGSDLRVRIPCSSKLTVAPCIFPPLTLCNLDSNIRGALGVEVCQ
jgi:hypothetical protein